MEKFDKSGSLPEVAGPAAEPFDPDDADALAARMRALLDDREAESATHRGLLQASLYSWSTCAEAARRAYVSALEVHAHRR